MKPKQRGWKEGIIKQNLCSVGSALNGREDDFKKGDLVRYKRYKEYDCETRRYTGKYEWHYTNLDNSRLVRTREFLIETIK